MRLDKYLKVSRIIKRRPVAKEVADKGRIKVLTVRVLEMKDSTKKEDATKMYEIINETRIEADGEA